jgi:hypothetical protein
MNEPPTLTLRDKIKALSVFSLLIAGLTVGCWKGCDGLRYAHWYFRAPRYYECYHCNHREGVYGGTLPGQSSYCPRCGERWRVVEHMSYEKWRNLKWD